MNTAQEMATIQSLYSRQTALDLRTAGYCEPAPTSESYPFLPVPTCDAIARAAGGVGWLRTMTTANGHCGQ